MVDKLNFALTVAGFDGSGGAGILADVKAMAHFGVYAQSACTALTVQNERNFVSPGFLPWNSIRAQLETLYEIHSFRFVKIGLVENADTLERIVTWLREKTPDVYIVWDPIMNASAGFRFFRDGDADKFFPVFAQMNLITPNQYEFTYLGLGVANIRDEVAIGSRVSVLLKGGHAEGSLSTDILWTDGGRYEFSSPRVPGAGKHGTGCTLSAAILANLALGKSLPEACEAAKKYMDAFLKGGEGRLGFV